MGGVTTMGMFGTVIDLQPIFSDLDGSSPALLIVVPLPTGTMQYNFQRWMSRFPQR